MSRLKDEIHRRQREVNSAKAEVEARLAEEIKNIKQHAKEDRQAIRQRLVKLKKMADENQNELQSLRAKLEEKGGGGQ